MRGMDRLAQLRRSGVRPAMLFLLMAGRSSGLVLEGEVIRESGDGPLSTDLRALVGLDVVVMGVPFGGFDDAEAWARAACRAGARNVALMFPTLEGNPDDGPVWIRVNGEDLA